jgi:hypothetical protein
MPVFTVPSALENTLVSDREQYPMLPTSVYGNKIVVGYEDDENHYARNGDECSEAVRRLNFLKKKNSKSQF